MKCEKCEKDSIDQNVLYRLGIGNRLCPQHLDEYQNEIRAESKKIKKDLHITHLSAEGEIAEKIFCAALLYGGLNTDQIHSVISEYLRMKKEVYHL